MKRVPTTPRPILAEKVPISDRAASRMATSGCAGSTLAQALASIVRASAVTHTRRMTIPRSYGN